MLNRWTRSWRHVAIVSAAGTALLCWSALALAQGRGGAGPNIGQSLGGGQGSGGTLGTNQPRVGVGSPQSTAIGLQGRAVGSGMINTGMIGSPARTGGLTNQLSSLGDDGFNSAGIAGASGQARVGQPGFNAPFRPQSLGGAFGTGPGSTVRRGGVTSGNPLAVNPLTSGLTGGNIPSAASPLTSGIAGGELPSAVNPLTGGLTGGNPPSAVNPLTSDLTGGTPPSAVNPFPSSLTGSNPLAVNPVNTGTVFLPAAGGSFNSTQLQPLLGFTLPTGSNVQLADNAGVLVLRGNLQAGSRAEATRQSLLIESLLRLQGITDFRNELRSVDDQPLTPPPPQ